MNSPFVAYSCAAFSDILARVPGFDENEIDIDSFGRNSGARE